MSTDAYVESSSMRHLSRSQRNAEDRRQLELDSGFIFERFPEVQRILLEVDFYDGNGKRVQRRRRDISPKAYAIFQNKCPQDEATLDLMPMISQMTSNRTKERSDDVECSGSRDRHTVSYRISIEYLPINV